MVTKVNNTVHNQCLFLLNELLRDGHNQSTLPLPAGALERIENGETFTGPELAALQQEYSKSYGHGHNTSAKRF